MAKLNSPVVNDNPTIGQLLNPVNINNVWTRHWKQQFSTNQSTFSSTYNVITKAPCEEFTHVRVILKNGEATPPAVVGVLLAPTASAADLTIPTVGNTLTGDASTGWTQVTFANASVPVLVAGSATNPTVLISDWMPLQSIAPTDGTTYPYVMARIKMSANYSALFTGVDNDNKDLDTYLQVTGQVTDGVTTPEGMTSQTRQSFSPIFGLEFLSSSRVIRVLCVGSSTTQGIASTPTNSGYYGWVPRAQTLLSNVGVPVNMINAGFSGQTTTQFAASGKVNVAAIQPAIVFYMAFSSNDGTPTQAIIDAQFARAMDFCYYALSNDAVPVLVFTCPNDAYNLSQDNFRKALITRCKSSGFPVLDMTSAVGDQASPEKFINAYRSGDGLHPNDAGYAAMAAICTAFVRNILSLNISF